MPTGTTLLDYLPDQRSGVTERCAIEEPGEERITYRELAVLSDRVRERLHALGVRRGDRVGIYLRKSIDTVAAILGVLKAGAAYVPVDPGAPPSRNAYILNDCSVTLVFAETRFVEALHAELARIGTVPRLLCLEGVGGGASLARMLREAQVEARAERNCVHERPSPDDLAYILYTSGSTGLPKGVMISHRNATSFVEWCSRAFGPTEDDRFSAHAPFHFDLSILDIYVPIKHRATLVLVTEEIGKDPAKLTSLIASKRLTAWYSAPSILSLLVRYGRLEQHDLSVLRRVLFAGEVFPIKYLRALKEMLPGPRYFNLYGPTETNVCTYYEVPTRIPDDRRQPFPIGTPCSHYQVIVVDEHGHRVPRGVEGELCASGPGVMLGYWNLPEQTRRAFLETADGSRWYKTGDIVVQGPDGNYVYVGRRDRMVKRRGYRIELDEIERALYRHQSVAAAAVVAKADEESGVTLTAFLSCVDGARLSVIELKRFCVENLPNYMVPDRFSFRSTLPKTSTDKIDYQQLKEMD